MLNVVPKRSWKVSSISLPNKKLASEMLNNSMNLLRKTDVYLQKAKSGIGDLVLPHLKWLFILSFVEA